MSFTSFDPSTNAEVHLDEGSYTLRVKLEARESPGRGGDPAHNSAKKVLEICKGTDLEPKVLEAGMAFEKAHSAAGRQQVEEQVWKGAGLDVQKEYFHRQKLARRMKQEEHARRKMRSLRISEYVSHNKRTTILLQAKVCCR